MNLNRIILISFLFFEVNNLLSQISPGALSAAHTHLEGISNCTKCHDIGKKVSVGKCLACHLDIKEKIEKNQGYHASKDLKAVSCIQCHSDHHGLKFEIVHFDKAIFNHTLTGYTLTGKHEEIDCKKCHDNKFILVENVRKKNFTYLGLDTKCKSCHEDVHRGTLAPDCNKCHTTAKFVPADKFDHKKTNYPLAGKHQEVKCIACHKIEDVAGIPFQKFSNIKFDQCTSCHQNVHDKKFGPNCSSCHQEQSFQTLKTTINFNHNFTDYVLKGKHRTIDCKLCHKTTWKGINTAFQDFSKRKMEGCISCHDDIHKNKFGPNCTSCHDEQSFKMQVVPSTFDHDLTDYKLEGKHETVDCKQCHKSKKTEALPHNQCINCHEDFHKGQFVQQGVQRDCADCHVLQSFSEVIYTVEDHALTKFSLEGAHLATPCIDCHKKEDRWTFQNTGTACVGCHKDVHENLLSSKYYPDKKCLNCHTVNSWKELKFDHNSTAFALQGKHDRVNCIDCHVQKKSRPGNHLVFKLQSIDCQSCHTDIHQNQFAKNSSTDCTSCHGFDDWKASKFDHNTAAFKLDGSHKKVSCDLCHKQIEIKGLNCIQYRLERFKCIDCHF